MNEGRTPRPRPLPALEPREPLDSVDLSRYSHREKLMRSTRRVVLAGVAALTAAACERTTPVEPPPDTPPMPTRAFGVIEVTITGIGTDAMSASALSAPGVAALERLREAADDGGLQAQSLDPPANADASGDGTIQLEPLASGSFTDGARGAGGVRYMFASYRVRNAQSDGTAYDTDRTNLTFLAVDTDGTIDVTPVSRLNRFDGTAAATSIAAELIPTGAAAKHPNENTIEPAGPDVLQVLTEADAADVLALAPVGINDVFPYGFVVQRNGSTATRTLPANPAVDQFDGVVTFAFRVPLQATSSDDPFTISAVFLATDDSETRLTQSLEEQTPDGRSAFEARAAALGAGTVSLLPGGHHVGAADRRFICVVRTAGSAADPQAHLVAVEALAFASLLPDPYAADGSASFITQTSLFQATFSGSVRGADPETFTVRGLRSGRAFLGERYSGNGTPTVATPSGSFFPGEELEVALVTGLSCGLATPRVARYRIASAVGPAEFTQPSGSPFAVGEAPVSMALGDLNGNGILDLALATVNTDNVSVLLGNRDGTFQTPQTFGVGDGPGSAAIGDLNGDGILDLAVANLNSNNVSVLLGDGFGTFGAQQIFATENGPQSIEIGDLNGNGVLDLAMVHFFSDNVSVLLGHGDGTFGAPQTFAVGNGPRSVALGDLDGDGTLDLVVANNTSDNVSVLLGNGGGTFGAHRTFAVGDGPRALAVGDLNGNGILDLAVGNQDADNVSVLLGNGDGTFQPQQTFAVGDTPFSVAISDLNGDGVLDLAVGNALSDNVFVLLGTGDGTFQPQQTFAVGDTPVSVAIGDLNGDGVLDLAVANRNSHNVTVLLNQ